MSRPLGSELAADGPLDLAVDIALADEAATVECGVRIGALVEPGDVILLIGDLGVGKTTWMRGLASRLAVDPALIRSPTFALIMEHERGDGSGTLLHADLYRADAQDLESLGLFELLGAPDVVAAIEWPEALLTHLRGLPVWTLRWRHGSAGDGMSRVVELRAPLGRATASLLPASNDGRPGRR